MGFWSSVTQFCALQEWLLGVILICSDKLLVADRVRFCRLSDAGRKEADNARVNDMHNRIGQCVLKQ